MICSKSTGLQGSTFSNHCMTTGFGPLRLLQKGSLIFRPTPFFFCSSLCVQYNTQRRKSTKSGEGLGTLVTRMMSGRRKVDVEGGGCPTTNSCVIYHRVSFLPVKSSIVDLVNIWALDYRWSA